MLVAADALLSDGAAAAFPVRSNDGELTARDVYPGTYQLHPISGSSAPYYLDSIRLGDRDAVGSVSIHSDAQPLIVTYKLGGGTVRGTIDACGSGHILLIPQDPPLRRIGFVQIAECGPNGRFEFVAVRPGEYYGLALSGDLRKFTALLEDDSTLKQATGVTVRANESTSAEFHTANR